MALGSRPALRHYDFTAILRPVDKITASIPCRIRTDGLEYRKAEAGVIVNTSVRSDEAMLMVVVPGEGGSNIRITHLIPLTKHFRHSLNQTPPSPSTSFFHQSSRPHITLTLWDDKAKVELRISSSLTVRVQAFIVELKRLIQLGSTIPSDRSCLFSWTGFYPVNPPQLKVDEFSDDEDDAVTPGASSSSTILSPSSSSTSVPSARTPLSGLTLGSVVESEKEDEDYPNPFAPDFSRTALLRKRLFARQGKWSSKKEIKIRLATYNVNDKLPPPGTTELTTMVGDGNDDLLVFGLQEVDLRSQALLISQGNVRADEWEGAILRALKERAGEYERVALTQYVGVVTIVLAKRSLREHLTRVETSEKGIGLLGFGGNKAGVCVRLQVFDTTLCFVNSHLAAFATALDRRRSDYQVLLRGLTFPRPPRDDIVPSHEEFLPEHRDRLISIEDAHVLFWVGDLNYRIDAADDILRTWVEEQRWKQILEKDQLLADIAGAKSFVGFKEPPIDFPPSFKYVHGSSTLDTRRSPAYTDRILYTLPGPSTRHSPPTELICSEYTSHEIFWSDHRPVSAGYRVQVRVADDVKRREEFVAVERELEKLEEVYRPSLNVDETSLNFGEVQLGVPVTRTILLKNIGKVPATFNFKTPGPEKPICKAPIWPVPSYGTIEPGATTALAISICVDESWSKRLTLGEEDLNDVLVLRVAEGKDTFITLQSEYRPSSIGLPLAVLARLSDPIQSTTIQQRKELLGGENDPYEGKKGPKPVKEIWRLLEGLMARAPYVGDIWSAHVSREVVLEGVRTVDAGANLIDVDSSIIARTIVFILSHLPTSLVDGRREECETVSDRDDAFAALEGLAQVNTNILIGLMSVVRLCAGVENTLAVATSAADEQTDGNLQAQGEADTSGETQMQRKSDAVDDLATPTSEGQPATLSLSAEAGKVEPLRSVKDVHERRGIPESTIEALVPAVFGWSHGNAEGRKRFIRCMLEG